jgi:WD40 repeat protein
VFLSACVLTLLPAAPAGPTVTAVGVSADGRFLCVARGTDKAGEVCVWDLSKPALVAVVPDVGPGVKLVQPTADGKRFVLAAGGDRSLWHATRVTRAYVWDVERKKLTHGFEVNSKISAYVAVSPDGNWVAQSTASDELKQPWRACVWNTDTGKVAWEVSKAATASPGTFAFTADSKRLVVARHGVEYSELDIATGEKKAGWKRDKDVEGDFMGSIFGAWVAPVPGLKALATVSPTGKRRQSYVVRLVTEKKDWFLAEFWDDASPPVVSPDGRWLVVSAADRADGWSTFVLRLDAEGIPELTDKPEVDVRPFAKDGKSPAWREWALGEANRAGREVPPVLAFSPDGKRVLAGGRNGQLRVYDAETKELRATLAVIPGATDAEWLISTPGGAYVGSAAQEKELAKTGKDRDPAKVKEALGVK